MCGFGRGLGLVTPNITLVNITPPNIIALAKYFAKTHIELYVFPTSIMLIKYQDDQGLRAISSINFQMHELRI